MLGRWMNDQGPLSMFDALERGLFDLPNQGRSGLAATLRDEGEALVLRADLPGLADGDVTLSLEGDVLSIQAERRSDVTEGFRMVRSERPAVRFSRSYELPCRVDGDATTAAMKDGVLTVTLPKAREARPRRIQIGAPS
jgi:HSP20 family protein